MLVDSLPFVLSCISLRCLAKYWYRGIKSEVVEWQTSSLHPTLPEYLELQKRVETDTARHWVTTYEGWKSSRTIHNVLDSPI